MNDSSPSPRRAPPIVLAVTLVVLAVVAYLPTRHAQFVWDDDDHFAENPQMTSAGGLVTLWREHEHTYPLTSTSWWILRRLFGLTPWPYHLLSALVHGLNALLLFRVLARLKIPGAWLAGAIFAVHPVHVQSVAWATELKNCQSGFFYLLSLLAWVRFREAEGAAARRWYAGALVSFVLAVASKTSTVVLAPLLPVVDLWQRRRLDRRFALAWLPFGGVVGAAGALTLGGHADMSVGPEWDQSPAQRLALAGRIFWFYLGKLFLPVDLSFVYPRWNLAVGQATVWVPIIALLVLLVIVGGRTIAGDRHGRPALFAVVYFLVALGPVLGFFNIYYQRYSWVADHWQYLASLGALAWAAGALTWTTRAWPPGLRATLAGLLLAVLGTATWRQAATYHDNETLYRHTLERDPDCWLARNNLGELLLQTGRVDEALGHFERVATQRPDDAEAENGQGAALALLGRSEEALAHYQAALRLRPAYTTAVFGAGGLLVDLGRPDDAVALYRAALEREPDSAGLHHVLGVALLAGGRPAEAVRELESALRLAPDHAEARAMLEQIAGRRRQGP